MKHLSRCFFFCQNTITDRNEYILENPESDEPNAAILSAADLNISGDGTLIMVGSYDTVKMGLLLAIYKALVTAQDGMIVAMSAGKS